ncbi:PSPA7_2676 family Cys-rich small protein [Pseudomonas sp. ML96]|uniref:PSPA7_2676 family Cys-rich small protein n=1 Tax=Pseudomonas sp. ML96 TaxID=1523503 RepID=UPI000A71FABB|nr:PSPA7_2676 family Cys-rich small protein [Pseudomonas sp. ML96]
MTLLCLISGCQWLRASAKGRRLGGRTLLHECCSRCGTRRFRHPVDESVLFSLRPQPGRQWS